MIVRCLVVCLICVFWVSASLLLRLLLSVLVFVVLLLFLFSLAIAIQIRFALWRYVLCAFSLEPAWALGCVWGGVGGGRYRQRQPSKLCARVMDGG